MELTADDIKARWGRRLKQARERNGESQVQFAVRIGRDPQTISRIERGQGSLESFVEVANALDVTLIELPEVPA